MGIAKKIATLTSLALISINVLAADMYKNLGNIGGNEFPLKENQKYELILFFNYNCNSCLEFEKYFENYEKNAPEFVSIKSIPTKIKDGWEWANRLHYYTKIIQPNSSRLDLYNTSFIQQHTIKSREDLLIALTEVTGLTRDKVEVVVETQDISLFEIKANKLAKKYNVFGTPTMVLNIKNGSSYKIQPNGELTYQQLIQVANGLIAFNEQKSSM